MTLPRFSPRRALVLVTLLVTVVALASLTWTTRESSHPASQQVQASVPVAVDPAAAAGSDAAPTAHVAPAAPSTRRTVGTIGTAGMRVARDPETGRLTVPSRDQLVELGIPMDLVEADYSEIPVTVLPGGVKKMTLDDRFLNFAVMRRAADGSLRMDCTDVHSANEAKPAPVWEVQ